MIQLYLGFGRADFTPDAPVSMNSTLTGSKVIDNLFVTCLAWRDENTTVLQYSMDLRNIYDPCYERLAPAIAKEVGIDEDHLILSVTHNHSAPDVALIDRPDIASWEEKIGLPAMCEAGKAALNDLAPVIGAEGGKTITKGLNFVRRYFREDGTLFGVAAKKSDSPLIRAETQADPELRAVKILRKGKKSVVLVNFQTHAASGQISHPDTLHADFVGPLRRVVEEKGDALCIYLQGACGNVNCNPKLPEDQLLCPGDCFRIGEVMGHDVLTALSNALPLKLDRIRFLNDNLTCTVNHAKSHLASIAKEILATEDKDKRVQMMTEAGITNRYENHAIIKRSGFGKTRQMPLSSLVLGDLAMGFAPVELFDTCGKAFRDASSYPMTFFCGYTHGSHSYMPSAIAFPNGGYEACECHYVPGTGEMIALKLGEMIQRKI